MLTKNQAEQLSESLIGQETSSRAVSLWQRVAEFFNPSNCPEFSQLSLSERLEIKQQAHVDVTKSVKGRVVRFLPIVLMLGYVLYRHLFNTQAMSPIVFMAPWILFPVSWISSQTHARAQMLAKELVKSQAAKR
jgi:hypothetical protein